MKIAVAVATGLEQYHNQLCHRESDLDPAGQRLPWEEEERAISVDLLFRTRGGFIRTTRGVKDPPSPGLEILICDVDFTLHPSFHPAIMPPAIKRHQNSNLAFSQAPFHISSRERPESSSYRHGDYTVCMKVKTMCSP